MAVVVSVVVCEAPMLSNLSLFPIVVGSVFTSVDHSGVDSVVETDVLRLSGVRSVPFGTAD